MKLLPTMPVCPNCGAKLKSKSVKLCPKCGHIIIYLLLEKRPVGKSDGSPHRFIVYFKENSDQ